MISADDVYSDLQNDLLWRIQELLDLQNAFSLANNSSGQRALLRALYLLLYAHVEGFTKLALLSYVSAINSANIQCSQAHAVLVAATLNDAFRKLRDPNYKKSDSEVDLIDADLWRLARETEFVEELEGLSQSQVSLPDSAVNTESNLWPVVLKKNLYRLGLPSSHFSDIEGRLHHLVNSRNRIAHGQQSDELDFEDYKKVRVSAFEIFNRLPELIFSAISLAWYRAPTHT